MLLLSIYEDNDEGISDFTSILKLTKVNQSANNKRIAKNTIFLYMRMLLILVVSLYTSRVVLQTLGVEDYGLYNVVGSIVAMFSFISAAMGNSTQRFITVELGGDNTDKLNKVFSTAILIHIGLAIIILMLAESVGLWFLYNKMVVPDNRFSAVFWVFQFSILSCMVSVVTVPYNMLIIAHEKMSAFAFISVVDVILKLLIVYLIQIIPYDKLILYALFILLVLIMDCCIYIIYCFRNFPESRYMTIKRSGLFKEMTSFAGWSLIGNLAYIGYTQGLNILLNIFFGPMVNAARGVAVQVQTAIKGFVTNFQTAVNPQITKSYANSDFNRLNTLIFTSSKMSFYLMLFLCLPIFIEAEFILSIWLKNVPDYTVTFLRLILLVSLIEPLATPIGIANNATGKIRRYQICEGGLLLLICPISYIFLKLGYPAKTVFIVQFFVSLVTQIVRVFLVRNKIHISFSMYFNRVLFKVLMVFLSSIAVSFMALWICPVENEWIHLLFVCILTTICVLGSVYLWGLDQNEKSFVGRKILRLKQKK